jgi:ribosomal protein S18 acetylase RimI-like enzyme
MQLVEVSYHFRAAKSSDVEIFYDSHLDYTNSFLRIGEFAAIFDAKLNDNNFHFFILTTGDTKKTIGCVALRYYQEVFDDEVIAEIAHFYIVPKYRKLQAADILYDFIETSCIEANTAKLTVACGINSTLNQRFYTRRKFTYIKKMFSKLL